MFKLIELLNKLKLIKKISNWLIQLILNFNIKKI